MSAVKGKNTEPELILRQALWARGHRYRLHANDLLGSPDLVFRRKRVAIFVDGDFWHGRLIQEGRTDAYARQFRHRRDWWLAKVEGNIKRDKRVRETLEAEGWIVVRVWESDIHADLAKEVERVECALSAQGS